MAIDLQSIRAHPGLRRRAWLGCGWFMVAALIGSSVLPVPQPPLLDRVDWGDKAVHMLAYASLMWWFAQAYARARWPVIAAALLLLGVTLEFIQSLLPYRTAEGADLVANTVGIACAYAGTAAVRPGSRYAARSR